MGKKINYTFAKIGGVARWGKRVGNIRIKQKKENGNSNRRGGKWGHMNKFLLSGKYLGGGHQVF